MTLHREYPYSNIIYSHLTFRYFWQIFEQLLVRLLHEFMYLWISYKQSVSSISLCVCMCVDRSPYKLYIFYIQPSFPAAPLMVFSCALLSATFIQNLQMLPKSTNGYSLAYNVYVQVGWQIDRYFHIYIFVPVQIYTQSFQCPISFPLQHHFRLS